MAVDNGSPLLKQRVRHQVVADHGAPSAVLECFIGEGALYQTCWRGAVAGVAMDMVADKVRAAAAERPHWLVACTEVEGAIQNGIGRYTPFDVVDVDAYGEPWPYVRAWMISRRLRARRTVIVCTDGYMAQRSIAPASKTLFGVKGRITVTDDDYLETAQARCSGWAAESGLVVESFRTFNGPARAKKTLMRQHVIVVHQPDGAAWKPEPEPGLLD